MVRNLGVSNNYKGSSKIWEWKKNWPTHLYISLPNHCKNLELIIENISYNATFMHKIMKNADAVASGDSGRRGDFGAFASH